MNWPIIILKIFQFSCLVGIVAILGYMAFVMISFKNMVPYVPTPKRIIRRMIESAKIKKGEKICDLGSGTGKIIIAAAQKHKSNLVIGIEKSFILRLVTRLRLFFHPFSNKRIQVLNHDFFNLDLYNFDVIFCFLTPEALRILAPKFKFLKKGSRIVTYMFKLEDYEGFEEVIKHISAKDSIFIYTKV